LRAANDDFCKLFEVAIGLLGECLVRIWVGMVEDVGFLFAADGNGELGDISVRWAVSREGVDRDAGTAGVVSNPAL